MEGVSKAESAQLFGNKVVGEWKLCQLNKRDDVVLKATVTRTNSRQELELSIINDLERLEASTKSVQLYICSDTELTVWRVGKSTKSRQRKHWASELAWSIGQRPMMQSVIWIGFLSLKNWKKWWAYILDGSSNWFDINVAAVEEKIWSHQYGKFNDAKNLFIWCIGTNSI